ncbi:class I lanthipeptide [Chitinophaga qingshengii]|uniref:Class I lanthipeptide n=2 Tax=Chitinophaga qingshengii TaxID=1569794 RepID=A0ABR7TXL5_9BACT|nr:class I lanthipeptide [Chitinophaga qingshengii]
MKKKMHLQKLVLSKKVVARLSESPTGAVAGRKISDPLTENPCDPLPSMVFCTRRAC